MSAATSCRVLAFALAVAGSVLVCSCAKTDRATQLESGISGYVGDGTIEDTSQPGGALPSRGYLIRFDTFDLTQPYEKTLRLGHLPILEHRKAGIYFVVEYPPSANRSLARSANVDILLTTAGEVRVTHVKSALSDLIWATPVHGYSGSALYDPGKAFFIPRPGERYRLQIKYTPGPAEPSGRGYVYVWCSRGGA
jgi:hypothetical protein